jgi:nitroreductase
VEPIALPKPTVGRKTSVFAALRKRRTSRSISGKKLSRQMLSNLLWSACGVNRKKGPFGGPGRTAASASNSQEIDIYVALAAGVYRYEPSAHYLNPVLAEDLRGMAIGPGQGRAGAEAPARLIYVADINRFSKAGFQEPGLWDAETQKAYYYVDTGLIAGNVYLFAAGQGLETWFHNCSKEQLARKLKLTKDQRVLFGQTIGYPGRA